MRKNEAQLSFDFEAAETQKIEKAGLARNSDPKTSQKAARSARSGTIRALILNALRENGPMATFQIAGVLDKDRDSISPHMKPLEKEGRIKRTGQTIMREKTRKECEVWEIMHLSQTT